MATSITVKTNMDKTTFETPFRLLDLPQELQDNIYSKYMTAFDLEIVASTADDHHVRGMADTCALRRTCRRVAEDVHKVQQKHYSGVLKLVLKSNESWALNAILRLASSSSRDRWVAEHTTIVDLKYIESVELAQDRVATWVQALSAMQQAHTIKIAKVNEHSIPAAFGTGSQSTYMDAVERMITSGAFDEGQIPRNNMGELVDIVKGIRISRGNLLLQFTSVMKVNSSNLESRHLVSRSITKRHLLIED